MNSEDIIIPSYNYASFLPDCVNSVLTQDEVETRVLIIDDASPDDMRLSPDNGNLYYSRGISYLNQGNKKQECRNAQKACEWGNCILLESPKGRDFCR
jgi:glycosyltransferase involved in cell wall biosynthesis